MKTPFLQIAFAIGVLTSSLRVGDRDISQFVAWGVSPSVSLVVLDRGCGWEVLHRVLPGASSVVFLAVLNRGIGWEMLVRVWHGVGGSAGLRIGWKMLRRVSAGVLLMLFDHGCGWRVSAGALLLGVLLLVVYDWYVVRMCHMVLVVVCEWDMVGRCCTGCNWWCVIARIFLCHC